MKKVMISLLASASVLSLVACAPKRYERQSKPKTATSSTVKKEKKDTGQKITSDGKTDSYADAMKIYKGDFTVPDYKTPGMKEVVQKMADLKKQYGKAVKASDQKRIKNEMKKIFKEFDSIHSDMKKRVESDLNLPFYYPYIYFKQGTIVLN